jgi:hypothetical protein
MAYTGRTKADIPKPVFAVEHYRNGEHTILPTQDCSGNLNKGKANSKVCCPLIADDMVGGIPNHVLDAAEFPCPVCAPAAEPAVCVDRNAGNVGHRPCRKLGIAMLSQNVPMYIVHIDFAIVAEKMPEASAVKNSARPHYAPSLPLGSLAYPKDSLRPAVVHSYIAWRWGNN